MPVIPFSVILWFFSPMESDQDDTPQQQQEEGDADTGGKKECSSKSHSLFPLSESSKKAQRREAQCKLYELQSELERLKLEADDSEESDVAENSCRSKSRAVHQECPIKPEKFPGNCFNRWELWVKHYKSIVKVNRWSDAQAIEALPACLTSWALEEFETVPRHYVEKVLGEKTPKFDTLLEVLEPKMQQYRSKRATRSEFRAVKQMESESLKDYFRRVRYLGDLALSGKSLAEKDQDLRDQFLAWIIRFPVATKTL